MPLFAGKCRSQVRLDGKTAVVTGCNTGIGKETVMDFYKRGGRVIMACRNSTKANAALEDIKKKCEKLDGLGALSVIQLDLNSLTSVRECAKEILATESKIDILVNNAGVMMCPKGKTEDGFETQFGTNHLGHFLFTLLLLPHIIKSAPARIVNVSSMGHAFGTGTINFDDLNYETRPYSAMSAYSQSKLANVLFSKELANKIKAHNIEGVTTYALHPGMINTELGRHLDDTYFTGLSILIKPMALFTKSPESGAQTSIYCAVDENVAKDTGLYYSDCAIATPSKAAQDAEIAQKLWDVSCNLVGLNNYDPFKV